MTKIVLDTNFTTIPFQFNADIYAELERIMDVNYEIVFPDICLAELKKLRDGKAALALMEKKGVKIAKVSFLKNVDDSIVEYAKAESSIIATQDRELKKKALKNGLLVISLRKKQFLIKTGGRV